ncbi:tape measure protein [Acinetobacter bereziniae]|uniref:tape measure protein n=1 Tax=Acinetobacter bereziniae TaxID=106648 RepID=UPI00066858C5|nr:tape measure protein [Acinetobacter bereziniae]
MAGELGVLTLDMVARTANFDQPLRRSNQVMSDTGRNVSSVADRIERDTGRMNVAFGSMGGHVKAALAGFTVGTIITMADGYTQMAARIRNATENTAEYNLVQQHLYETANGTYRALSEAQEVYLGLNGGMQALGKTTQQTLAVSDSLSFAFVHNASRADQAQSAIDALSKAMATQKVDADGWISIVSAADNIIDDLAQTTGKSAIEIRKLGVQGKISLDDLLKTLELTRDKNKELADAMENSLADGFQKVSNAVTVYVGQANQATGATSIMASGLSIFADNIDTVVNGAMVYGAYMAGTYIPVIYASTAAGASKVIQLGQQVVAENAVIQAERMRAVQSIATAQATLTALAAEKALEAQRLASQINAQGRMASVTRMAELRRIETQVTRELTVAETALAAAQGRSAVAGGAILGMLGGPVGIGLTVATVAAGYLLMRDNTAEANKELERQSQVAMQTKDQLLALEGVKRQGAKDDLSAAFKAQNQSLKELNYQFNAHVIELQNAYRGNLQITEISNKVRLGQLSQKDAIEQLNKLDFITPTQLNQVIDSNKSYEEQRVKAQQTSEALSVYGIKTTLAGNAASNAAGLIARNTSELHSNKEAAESASEAQQKYAQSLADRKYYAEYKRVLMETYGFAEKKANEYAEAQKQAGGAGARISVDQKNQIGQTLKAEEQLQSLINRRNEAEKKANQKPRTNKPRDTSEQEANLREQIIYGSYSRQAQIHADYLQDVHDINKANFQMETQKYLKMAKDRYDLNNELYQRSLAENLDSWQWSEKDKAQFTYDTKVIEVSKSNEFEANMKAEKLKSMADEHNHQMGLLDLASERRISDAGESLRSNLNNIEIQYAFERQEIARNFSLSEEEQRKRLDLLEATHQFDKRKRYESAASAWGGTYADMTGQSEQYNIDQTRFSRYDESQDLFDSQMALADTAAQREAIWLAHNDRMYLIEKNYSDARTQLGLQTMQGVFGGWSNVFKEALGEQSGFYKAAFIMQKAASIAEVTMNAPKTFSSTLASVSAVPLIGPYIAPAMAAGAVALQYAQVGMLNNVQLGFYGGGYTGDGGKYEDAGRVHKGEVVWSQDDLRAWGGKEVVESLRTQRSFTSSSPRSTPKINLGDSSKVSMHIVINNYSTAEVNAKQNADGTVNIDIVDQRIAQSWQRLRSGNSNESQAIQGAFGLAPSRG